MLMALVAPLAMQAQREARKGVRPTLQTAPALERTIQNAPQTREAGWLQYDNGTLATNLGSSTAYYWTYGPMFPASMLGNNNTLSKVSFYETSYMITDVTIEIYSGGDEEPQDLIYTEVVTLNGTSGFHEVEFAEPITIDPTQNLWVAITVGGTYVMPLCQCTEGNNDWWNNGGWGHMSEAWQSGYGWMIRAYVEYVDPTNTCPKPTGLTATNVTPYAATLSWHSSEEVTAWQIVYGTDANFNPDNANPIDVDANPYTLTNLTDGTTYYAYVRAMCDKNEFSAWSSMTSFTTPSACTPPFDLAVSDITPNSANVSWDGYQDAYTLRYKPAIFFDGFENGLDNWTIYTEGEAAQTDGWYTINPLSSNIIEAHTGSYVASSWSWNSSAYNADNWLVSPQIDLQGTLSFWVYTNPGYPDSYEVLLSTAGNATTDFTVTLQEMAEAPSNGVWNEVSIDLSAYTGQQGYIAIHHVSYDANYLFIDDFLVLGNDEWVVENNATSPLALEGLSPETGYCVQIQGTCPSGLTDWSAITFNTLTLCEAPNALAAEDITANSATLSWTGYQDSYNVTYWTPEIWNFSEDMFTQVGEDYTTGATLQTYTFDLSAYSGQGHVAIRHYNITDMYRLNVDDIVLTDANGNVVFTTDFEGDVPSNLMIYDHDGDGYNWGLSQTQEDANGNPTGNGTYYAYSASYDNDYGALTPDNWMIITDVELGGTLTFVARGLDPDYAEEVFGVFVSTATDLIIPASEPVLIENVTNPYTLTGLDPETIYYWQVQGINATCDGGVTEWSNVYAFMTTEQTTLTQTIALSAGANWFSTYVDITLAELQAALVATGNTSITIASQTQSTSYQAGRWRGALTFDVALMYKITVAQGCEITLEGMPIDPAMHPITIKNGSNYIGFPFSENMTLANAFNGFAINGDMVKSQSSTATYIRNRWNGAFDLVPGKGYIYQTSETEQRIFTYPTNTSKSAQPKKMVATSSFKSMKPTDFNIIKEK